VDGALRREGSDGHVVIPKATEDLAGMLPVQGRRTLSFSCLAIEGHWEAHLRHGAEHGAVGLEH
jgi:hypothetical protein